MILANPDYGVFYEGYDDYHEILYDNQKEGIKDKEIVVSNTEQMLLAF